MRLRPLACLVAVTVLVAGCESEPEVQSSPQQVADELATAIETGDFSAAHLVDGTTADAQAARTASFEALADYPLDVTAVDVRQEGDQPSAQGTLRLTWDLPGDGDDLVREAPVRLRQSTDKTWSVSWEHALLGLPKGQVFAVKQVPAPRADIVDRDGEPLATAREVWRFGIDKTQVKGAEAEQAAQALADAAGLDGDAFADKVKAAGERAFVELITYRQSDQTGQDLHEQVSEIDGALAVDDELVLGPTRTFAQPLLGTVGPVTAEMLEAEPDRYESGDVAGLSGLQAAFDEQLTGTPGLRVTTVDAPEPAADDTAATAGTTTATTGQEGAGETVLEREPSVPDPLTLTLSTPVQELAEDVLADVEPPSAVVAIRPSTGDVLAMAIGPGSQGVDTALASQYPPGSTFKLASSLVLLRGGATPQTTVRCEPELTVDGYRFHNVPGYPQSALGDIPLATAIAHSCNTAMVGLRDQISMPDLATAARDLGMGGVWEMPVTAFSGSVPDEAATETEHAASLIGQGKVLASPTAMAVVAASIAEGRTVVPRVVAGQEVPTSEGALTPGEAEGLRTLMRAVVTDGAASMLADNPGPPIMAKTGTAEFGEQDPPQTHVWMIAVQGDLAVAVFVEEGELGSTTAGPIMDDFLTRAVELGAVDAGGTTDS